MLSNYDDMIANVTADTVDNAASVTPKLYEGWCRRDHKGSAVQVICMWCAFTLSNKHTFGKFFFTVPIVAFGVVKL